MAYRFRDRPQVNAPKTTPTTQILPETLWADEPMPSGVPPANTVVVTISRQFGSGGAEIGQMLAQKAGLHYIDHEIINEVARRSGIDMQHAEQQDEQTTGMAGHILSAVRASSPFTVNYDALSNTLSTTSMLTQSREQASLHLTQRVILELATRGNAVIVGRGSQFLLHGAPRTLHIYIFAPLPYRIENVMRRYHVTYSEATHRIEQADFEHDRYLRHYYGNDGHQPGLYHLLINTGLFSFELAVNLIYESLPVIKEIR